MLFSTYQFIFLFLPIALVGHRIVRQLNFKSSIVWLNLCSLAFYGYWKPEYLVLLLATITSNYLISFKLGPLKKTSKVWLIFGVSINLSLLAFFKYTNFLLENFQPLVNFQLPVLNVILPLGISFFTFQQISYIVDMHRENLKRPPFYKYLLCITFFPHLIAGPLLHFKDILPQVNIDAHKVQHSIILGPGLVLFSLGLFKKLVLADPVGAIADQAFNQTFSGVDIGAIFSALGTIAYTIQIYLDFSGYSEMAIGLGLMFGIQLPENFRMPYLSLNIIDFWRRWHMTLSRFLKNYLYILLLGGNRLGNVRRNMNLLITMLLGGLWHGAGWTFVIWGGLHGFYLLINHSFHNFSSESKFKLPIIVSWMITIVAVMFAWIFFRAQSLDHSFHFLKQFTILSPYSIQYSHLVPLAAGLTWMTCEPWIYRAKESWKFAAFISLLLFTAILFLGEETAFIYFNF
jgi:alginate O-acetyltransferase complex protein AlgI